MPATCMQRHSPTALGLLVLQPPRPACRLDLLHAASSPAAVRVGALCSSSSLVTASPSCCTPALPAASAAVATASLAQQQLVGRRLQTQIAQHLAVARDAFPALLLKLGCRCSGWLLLLLMVVLLLLLLVLLPKRLLLLVLLLQLLLRSRQ